MIIQRSSNYWDKRALQRLSDAEKKAAWHFREIALLYDEAQKETVDQVKKIYEAYYRGSNFDLSELERMESSGNLQTLYNSLAKAGISKELPKRFRGRITRLESINAQLWTRSKRVALLEEEIQSKAHSETIYDSFYKTIFDTSEGIGYTPQFSELNTLSIDNLLNTSWQGKNYSKRIWGNTSTLASQLQQTLTKAIMTGMSPDRTIREIQYRFGVAKSYAERLIRTETNHFENESEYLAYKEMGVKEYVFVSTLDSRTSEMCQKLDGQRFKFSERKEGLNWPPIHPYCRSTIRGYISDKYEPKIRSAINKKGGRDLIPNISYETWIKSIYYRR